MKLIPDMMNPAIVARRITTFEYESVLNTAIDLGLTAGYMQQKSSAKEEYTPPFDLTGI